MIKKLTKHRNSLALVIDKPVLDLLGANDKTRFEVATDGKSLRLTPLKRPRKRDSFEEALHDVNRRYGRALKKLAE